MNVRKSIAMCTLATMVLLTVAPISTLGHGGLPLPAPATGPGPINVSINGQHVYMFQPPFIENSRSLVPLRALMESIGAVVGWDPATRQITISLGETRIGMVLDSALAYVNGKAVTLDVVPTVRNGRTFVPVRFVAESLGARVGWEADTRTIQLDIPGVAVRPATDTLPSLGVVNAPGLSVALYRVEEHKDHYQVTIGPIPDQSYFTASRCLTLNDGAGADEHAAPPDNLQVLDIPKSAKLEDTQIYCQGIRIDEVQIAPGQQLHLPVPKWLSEAYPDTSATLSMNDSGTEVILTVQESRALFRDGFRLSPAFSVVQVGPEALFLSRRPAGQSAYSHGLNNPTGAPLALRIYSSLTYPPSRLTGSDAGITIAPAQSRGTGR